jgi:serine/threonine protein kinase
MERTRTPLTPGTRLGSYEIISPLGAGGMGEVFRARDAKLSRDVALKILPAVFALDPDRLARFKRDAQVQSDRNGDPAIFSQPIHGGVAEQLTKPGAGTSDMPESWFGDVLLFTAKQ